MERINFVFNDRARKGVTIYAVTSFKNTFYSFILTVLRVKEREAKLCINNEIIIVFSDFETRADEYISFPCKLWQGSHCSLIPPVLNNRLVHVRACLSGGRVGAL